MINWRIVIPGFFLIVFLIRYYDFFYIYLPVRTFVVGGEFEPTILSFTLYNYSLKVLYYLFKFFIIGAVISAGVFLEGKNNKENVASIGSLFTLAVSAEFAFLLADIIKILDFSLFTVDYDDQDYTNYYPLSFFSLFDIDTDSPFSKFLQTINVFEVIYVLLLGYGLKELQYPDSTKGYKVAAISYGSLVVFWTVLTTYIKLV
jgi:hypothetical protein